MNMKIQLKHLQNRTSNIKQEYATINKSIIDKLNPPNLYRFFCLSLYRSIYCIPPIEHPNFITLSHLFMKMDLDIKVKGYYIKLLLIAEDNKILLTPNKLADKLGMGKKSVESYNLDLYGAGLLRYIPKGIELTPKELLLDNDIAKQRKEWNPINSKNVVKMAFKSK